MTIWSDEIKVLDKLYISFKGHIPDLEKELEQLITTLDANVALLYSRRSLEVIIIDLCEFELGRSRKTEPLMGIIDKLNKEEKVPPHIIVSMKHVNSLSTFGAHPKKFDAEQVKPVLNNLTTIIKWYLKYKADQTIMEPKAEEERYENTKIFASFQKKSKPKKMMIIISGLLLVCVIFVVVLVAFDVIGGQEQTEAKDYQHKSIAVLPFINDSPDKENQYFINGTMEAIMDNLCKIEDLRVISRTLVEQYRENPKPTPVIADEMNVDYILEGSGQKYGNKVRLTLQLIDARNDKHLWSSPYNREILIEDIFSLQSEIAKLVATEIKAIITPVEKQLIEKIPTTDLTAYDAYLKGQFYMRKITLNDLDTAMQYYDLAKDKDPEFALAYAGIGNVWMMFAQMGFKEPSTAVSKAYENLNKALELDPDLPDVHHLIGWIAFVSEWDWVKAEREFLKALAINPNDAMSRIWYAHLLCILQRADEALPQARLAIDLDPLNPVVQIFFSTAQWFINGCEADLTQIEKLLADDPDNLLANYVLNLVSFRCGDYDKVIETEPHYLQLIGRQFDEAAFKEIERIYNEQGFSVAYEKIVPLYEDLANNKIIGPMELAIIYTKANQYDKVMDLIEIGYEIRDHTMPYIALKAYNFKPLYDNPRFIAICEKMNLPFPKN